LSNDAPVPSVPGPHPEPERPVYHYPPARRRFQNRLWVHIGLFALTFLTTTLTGAGHYFSYLSEFDTRPVSVDFSLLLNGLWYSGTILGILLAHEMGHYLYCRRYNLDASLPYFLPLPPLIFLTGTLGAVIRIREPFRTRTELFDVGIAGPIGGLLVLIPALFYGLTLSPIVPAPTEGTIINLGEPLLFQWAAFLVVGPIAEGSTINMHPMVFACWFGIFATALNLLPFGQLDGGHIVYSVFGDRVASAVSVIAVVVPAFLILLSSAWIVPAILMAVMWRLIGRRHPPPLNPYEPLQSGRRAVAVVALVAFVVCFTPMPFWVEELIRPR
jgi:membrane-associated protease RseP (regulator of RpoE activity)